MGWTGHVAQKNGMGQPEGKIRLGKPRHRWEDNIKMDGRAIGWMWCGLDSSEST
jgi:hypothetical protein